MLPMMKVDEARNRILERVSPLGFIRIPAAEANGRVLAEDIVSRVDLPAFSNSAVDGFAVLHEDVEGAIHAAPVNLVVVDDIPAGRYSRLTLQHGQSARIMTGAPIPAGTTAVIPVEDTDFNYREANISSPGKVMIYAPANRNGNIRFSGEDVKVGERILQARKTINPQEIGFLSMLGLSEVTVCKKPRVAIFSTGDELLEIGEKLKPGMIYDSNGFMLQAQVERSGGIPIQLGIVPDLYESVKACLEKAAAQKVDIIVSSAGVSVGAFDFVRRVVEENGELEFWRVNMRPGKPLTFGSYKGIPFFGLPGNPVSAYIGYEIFVRPAVRKMGGILSDERLAEQVILEEDISSDGRESYLRAFVQIRNGRKTARLTGHQGSGNLKSLVDANALLIIPSGVKSVAAGEQVDFIWI